MPLCSFPTTVLADDCYFAAERRVSALQDC
jgi:hypothetical protein